MNKILLDKQKKIEEKTDEVEVLNKKILEINSQKLDFSNNLTQENKELKMELNINIKNLNSLEGDYEKIQQEL